MKPISTVPRALATLDVATGEEAVAIHQRCDVCAVPRAGVVAEAMVALVVADAALEKFGGDSLAETRRNARAYREAAHAGRTPGRRAVPARPGRASGRSMRASSTLDGREPRRPDRRPVLVLVGPPGAGKTTVGRLLARRLGVSFTDVDALIVERIGKPIADDVHRGRRGRLPRAGAGGRRGGARAPRTGCSRSAAGRCSPRPPASGCAGTAWCCCGSGSPTGSGAPACRPPGRCWPG